jgi:hypothetical protein
MKIKKTGVILIAIMLTVIIPTSVFADHIDSYLRTSKVFNPDTYEYDLPEWVRHIAYWWGTGDMSDSDYFASLQYLIDNNYIKIKKLT